MINCLFQSLLGKCFFRWEELFLEKEVLIFPTLCRFQKKVFFFSAIFAEFLQRQSLNEEEFLEIKEPYLYPGFREVAVDDHDDSVLHLLKTEISVIMIIFC